MSTTKEDRSFKSLINRETTSSVKFFFNEFGADTINVHTDDVWADAIPFNDPTQAVVDGVVELRTLFVMTEDLSVPSAQAWKAHATPGDTGTARLKDWVSSKFGPLFEPRLFDNNDNEIFTTDPVDWFFDTQTGILTFDGNALIEARPFKITAHRYVGSKGNNTRTSSDMTIPVDYEDVNAVDPPTGKVFTSQVDIDNFLAENSATNFKHLKLIWDALPLFVFNNTIFNLAAGVHRPDASSNRTSWELSGKQFFNGVEVDFIGASSSSFVEIIASQAITGVQTDSNDPFVDSAGTPYLGLDVRGLKCVFSTGQIATIHDHTDSRLFLLEALSPDPTGGSFVISVPGTQLRNTINDTSRFANNTAVRFEDNSEGIANFENILIDGFGASSTMLRVTANIARFTNCIIDQVDSLGIGGPTRNGTGIRASSDAFLTLTSFSLVALPNTTGPDQAISVRSGSRTDCLHVYVQGGEDGCATTETDSLLQLRRTVLEGVGVVSGFAISIATGSRISMQEITAGGFRGKRSEIRNTLGIGIRFRSRGSLSNNFQAAMVFTNTSGPCVQVEDDIRIALSGQANTIGWLDGGGNLDLGFNIVGPSSLVLIDDGTTITGANGDIKIEGIAGSYSDLGSESDPLKTKNFNTIGKEGETGPSIVFDPINIDIFQVPIPRTLEPFTITIDSIGGTDPTGPVFISNQAQATAQGTFATAPAALDALPSWVQHTVRFEFTDGQHILTNDFLGDHSRFNFGITPGTGQTSFVTGKIVYASQNGLEQSSGTASMTVSTQVLDVVTMTADPSLVANAFRGNLLKVVSGTGAGQAGTIVAHSGAAFTVAGLPFVTPLDGTSTMEIQNPAADMRIPDAISSPGFRTASPSHWDALVPIIEFESIDLSHSGTSSFNGAQIIPVGPSIGLRDGTRCLKVSWSLVESKLILSECFIDGDGAHTKPGILVRGGSAQNHSAAASASAYIRGFDNTGIQVGATFGSPGGASDAVIFGTVIDDCNNGIFLFGNSFLSAHETGGHALLRSQVGISGHGIRLDRGPTAILDVDAYDADAGAISGTGGDLNIDGVGKTYASAVAASGKTIIGSRQSMVTDR